MGVPRLFPAYMFEESFLFPELFLSPYQEKTFFIKLIIMIYRENALQAVSLQSPPKEKRLSLIFIFVMKKLFHNKKNGKEKTPFIDKLSCLN